MPSYREVDIEVDKDALLELHCEANYESETTWAREVPYESYREKWLSTSQPESFISSLRESTKDERTIAEILEEEGEIIGYVWVKFSDIPDYDITLAEIMDIVVVRNYRRRGVGLRLMKRIESLALNRGANLIRSDAGVENTASQRLHERAGFRPYRIVYEKVINEA